MINLIGYSVEQQFGLGKYHLILHFDDYNGL